MKPSFLVILLLVLIMAAGWILWHSIGPGPNKEPAPQGNRPRNEAPAQPSTRRSRSDRTNPVLEFDWLSIASELRQTSKWLDKLTPSAEAGNAIAKLSRKELIEARQAVLNGDLESRDKDYLLRYLTACYVRRDPEAYLRDNQGIPPSKSSQLWWEGYALAEWTRISPEEAAAWLKNESSRSREEKQVTTLGNHLFSTLLVTDFEESKKFLLSTPEDLLFKLIKNFDGFGTYWRDGDFEDHNIVGRYAEIARLYPPGITEQLLTWVMGVRGEQDRPAGISRIQSSLKDWDQGRGTTVPATSLADYLVKMNATPLEEALCLQAMAAQFRYFHPEADQKVMMARFTEEVRQLRSLQSN